MALSVKFDDEAAGVHKDDLCRRSWPISISSYFVPRVWTSAPELLDPHMSEICVVFNDQGLAKLVH